MKRMKRTFIFGVIMGWLMAFGMAQVPENTTYQEAFSQAYQACPDVPRGWLEAIAFTNTHCHHLTDDHYFHEGPDAMPRAYGLMGLVKDGKGYFRENLHLVSQLSGIAEEDILASPTANVTAYAMAFSRLANELKAADTQGFLSVIERLSELPIGEEKDVYPMQSMLYSVCLFLNDADKAAQYGFPQADIDLKAVFAEHYELLHAPVLGVNRSPDYPPAIWDPAPECNWEPRTKQVSAVVIHYTEGSYAGCISWFKNCDAEVSAHYVIRSADGQITQMVLEKDKAWHARTANGYTIGIEHEAYGNIWSFFTPEMYQSSANLLRSICERYDTISGHRTFYMDTLDNGYCLNNGLHSLGGEGACIEIRGHQHYPDQSHTDPGPYWDWNYYYKLINEGTPINVLEGEQGRLDHTNYGDDERRIWVIRGPEGSTVSIHFDNFHLEQDYDFLWIYDGDNVYARKIGRWNTQSPRTVTASGNVMCLEFRSDCLTTDAGWEATWTAANTNALSHAEDASLCVAPTPFTDRFTITAEADFAELQVYDLYGNLLFTDAHFEKAITIDASQWASGVYMVSVKSANGKVQVLKLVKL